MKSHILFALIILLFSCKEEQISNSSSSNKNLKIHTVNYPLAYFAKIILGELASVSFDAPEGIDPSDWQPNSEEISQFQNADLILLNGANYAKWVKYASLSQAKLFNTSQGFEDQYIHIDGPVHTHGDGEEHTHHELVFTLWIDFSLAAKQAETIYAKLLELNPQNEATLKANFEKLNSYLLKLHEQMLGIGKELNQRPIITSHPVYQYMAKAYSLNIQSVHWEPEQILTESDLEVLNELHEGKHKETLFIWEGQSSEANIEILQELGYKNIVFPPYANTPKQGDWIELMQHSIHRLRQAI